MFKHWEISNLLFINKSCNIALNINTTTLVWEKIEGSQVIPAFRGDLIIEIGPTYLFMNKKNCVRWFFLKKIVSVTNILNITDFSLPNCKKFHSVFHETMSHHFYLPNDDFWYCLSVLISYFHPKMNLREHKIKFLASAMQIKTTFMLNRILRRKCHFSFHPNPAQRNHSRLCAWVMLMEKSDFQC